jgi:hypothetical protein
LQVPSTEEEWKEVSNEFLIRWNFPHCIGAMDGKHVAIKCPANSGSNFYNYKNFFSIVLFAIVDADYKFLYVDCQLSYMGFFSLCQAKVHTLVA